MEETNFTRVGEFHSAFNHPKHDTPQMDVLEKESKLVALRYALINEELKELGDAIKQKDMVEVADALCDILYVTYGAGHAFGLNLDTMFKEVQRSNMSKLCEKEEDAQISVEKYIAEGRYKDPKYKKCKDNDYFIVYDDATGKILKNHKYSPANLKQFLPLNQTNQVSNT